MAVVLLNNAEKKKRGGGGERKRKEKKEQVDVHRQKVQKDIVSLPDDCQSDQSDCKIRVLSLTRKNNNNKKN